jgi:hypothetical protein
VKLRKLRNGNIYWVHFTLNGEFWRKSTCTSNRAEAQRIAEEIVREASAGNIQRTYTPAERRDRMGETQKRSQSDPKTKKAKKAPWTKKARKRHGRKMRKRAKGKAARDHISIATTQGYDRKRQKFVEELGEELGEKQFHRWASARTKTAWDRDDYREKQTAERRRRGRTRKFRQQMRAQTKRLHGTEKYQKAVAEGREKSSIAQLREKGYTIAEPGAPQIVREPRTRKRKRKPRELAEPVRIALAVERLLGNDRSKKALVDAREAVFEEEVHHARALGKKGIERRTISAYHERYVREKLRESRNEAPPRTN